MRVAHGLDEIGGFAAGHDARAAQDPLEGVLDQVLGVAVPATEMPRDPRQALHVRGQALGVEGAGDSKGRHGCHGAICVDVRATGVDP